MARTNQSAAVQLAAFLRRFEPKLAADARRVLKTMRTRLPGAYEMVYDKFNALVVGFSPTERPSDAIFSVVVYPRWINLFFLQNGCDLPDPEGVLQGGGKRIRHIRLTSAEDLQKPAIATLMMLALEDSDVPFRRSAKGTMVIRQVSAKQRPRQAVMQGVGHRETATQGVRHRNDRRVSDPAKATKLKSR